MEILVLKLKYSTEGIHSSGHNIIGILTLELEVYKIINCQIYFQQNFIYPSLIFKILIIKFSFHVNLWSMMSRDRSSKFPLTQTHWESTTELRMCLIKFNFVVTLSVIWALGGRIIKFYLSIYIFTWDWILLI